MTHDPDDVVKVFSGTLLEAEAFQRVLDDAGIESKVVGGALSAGLGTAIPGSVELWTHRSVAEKAVEAIQRDEAGARGPHGGKFAPPTSDPTKPASVAHRKEPHVKQDPLGE